MPLRTVLLLIAFLSCVVHAAVVTINVDGNQPLGELSPIWRFYGYDEPNFTYMTDGKRLLGELGQLAPKRTYIRCHNLLTSGDGTPALKWGSTNAYTEDASGRAVYDWTIVDRIFDTYLERGCKPFVQIGFMPQALSARPEPYQHHWKPGEKYSDIFTGWTYPPRDYAKWRELNRKWAEHCVEKYGKAEVESWYWEVWNEPNGGYFHGTVEEYEKLYDFAVAGVRDALPTARVGGPHSTGPGGEQAREFLRKFLEHCVRGKNYASGEAGSPIDFIAFHAKGSPKVVDGHVRMGISNQLNDIDRGFETVASFPELKDKPIVIGESDPDGCAACPSTLYPQNAYRNGTLYAAYTAAAFARKHELAAKHGVNLLGAVTWAFEFEDQPYFGGYRVLSSNGVDLPVLNVFRMFSMLEGKRIATSVPATVSLETITKRGVRDFADVSAFASLGEKKLCVMVWNYHDDDVPAPAAKVELRFAGMTVLAKAITVKHYRIDDDHSNAYTAWQRMGSPAKPSAEEQASLARAGKLAEIKAPMFDGQTMNLSLPRQAVSLLVLSW